MNATWLKSGIGIRRAAAGALWAAIWLAAGAAGAQSTVYVLDLAWKELVFTNRPALGETAAIELRNLGTGAASNLTLYLSNRNGDMLAIAEGMTATGSYAVADLALTSTNLLAEFDGVSTAGSRTFDFSVWDSARSRLLASALIEIRHNPIWESLVFTNLPAPADLGLAEYLVWGGMETNGTPSVEYTIDLATKDLTAFGRLSLAERAAILLKNCGDANPDGILLYLSTKAGDGMALQAGLTATTNSGEAFGVLNLATTNLVAEFSGAMPTAERAMNLTVWDGERDRMLASYPVPVRNNPLAQHFVEGWTNIPEAAETEFMASIEACVAQATDAQATAEAAAAQAQSALDLIDGLPSIPTDATDLAGLGGVVEITIEEGTNTESQISNGVARLIYKPGSGSVSSNDFAAHQTNAEIHVSASNRTNWDGKASLADVAAAGFETAAHAAETYQPTGNYLTAETDALALEAISVTSNEFAAHQTNTEIHVSASNRTNWDGKASLADVAAAGFETVAHAAETYQPTGNYLTAETDALALAAIPTNAVCAGGSYNPDAFGLFPAGYAAEGATNVSSSTTTTNAEYLAQVLGYSPSGGFALNPTIYSAAGGSTEITWQVVSAGSTATVSNNVLVFNAETQAVVTGVLGGYSDATTLVSSTGSGLLYVTNVIGGKSGTARGLVEFQLRYGLSIPGRYMFDTNRLLSAMCWVSTRTNYPTCLSVSNSGGANGAYYHATAITRDHVVFAEHFAPAVGSTMLFVDLTNGHHRVTLAARTNVDGDCSVGRLSDSLPVSIVPAKFLPSVWTNYIRDTYQFPVLFTDQENKALIGELARGGLTNAFVTVYQPASEPFLSYYEVPVGGDSGNPVLAPFGVGQQVILTSLYGVGGPNYNRTELKTNLAAKVAAMGGTYTNLTDIDFGSLGASVLP